MTETSVLHIASGDLWAGAEAQILALAIAQRRLGIDVAAVILNAGRLADDLARDGIPTLALDESHMGLAGILRSVVGYARERRVTVLHSHRQKENLVAGLASVFCRCTSVRTVHGLSEMTGERASIKRHMIDGVDHMVGRFLQNKVVAVSDAMRCKLSRQFPVSHLTAIENGLDLSTYLYADADSSHAAREDVNAGRLEVAFFGRLAPVKRLDVILDIAQVCLSDVGMQRVEFFIYGDGQEREWLDSEIAHRRLTNVHALGHIDAVADKMRQHDILLLTSDHEGLPMTVLEAMACGLVVLAHSVGGIPEALGDGACGLLVDSQEPQEYVKRLREFIETPGLHAETRASARARLESRYSIDRTAVEYVRLYDTLR